MKKNLTFYLYLVLLFLKLLWIRINSYIVLFVEISFPLSGLLQIKREVEIFFKGNLYRLNGNVSTSFEFINASKNEGEQIIFSAKLALAAKEPNFGSLCDKKIKL